MTDLRVTQVGAEAWVASPVSGPLRITNVGVEAWVSSLPQNTAFTTTKIITVQEQPRHAPNVFRFGIQGPNIAAGISIWGAQVEKGRVDDGSGYEKTTSAALIGDEFTLPSSQAAYVSFEWAAAGAPLVSDIFSLADAFSPTDIFATAPGASIDVTPQIALSTDGVTFGNWQDWVPGAIYTFKTIKFRVLLHTDSATTTASLTMLKASILAPRRVDDYKVTTSGSADVTITYSNPGPFLTAPTISSSIIGAVAGDLVTITAGSPATDYCTVSVFNGGVRVVRTVHITPIGY